MTQIYSLAANGKPVVTVSMEIPDFITRAPKLNRTWLKGIITEQVPKASSKSSTRTKPAKAKMAVA